MSLQWYDLADAAKQTHKDHIAPTQRWGHSGCSLKDPYIILFGGYSDSKYFNDTWIFNWSTLQWIDIQSQTQTISPDPRSNCTLVYDEKKERALIFGGGSASNLRHNDIWVLDLKQFYQSQKKQAQKYRQKGIKKKSNNQNHSFKPKWKLQFKSNNNDPISEVLWPRTYHAGIIVQHFLFVQGGQGYGNDLDDLWCFNMKTKKWKEIKTNNTPKARRFHTGVKIENYFYIIGGCFDGYNCLNDIHRIDLSRFIKKQKEIQMLDQNFSSLACQQENHKYSWQCVNIIDQSLFLARWGHMSCVIDNNIYIYGGRSYSDHQDVLLVQTKTDKLSIQFSNSKSVSLKSMSSNPQYGKPNSSIFSCKKNNVNSSQDQINPITEPMRISKLKCVGTPKGRRRGCLWVVGSCMILHGGFNGAYFDDMSFINVHETIPLAFQKLEINQNLIFPSRKQQENSPSLSNKKSIYSNKNIELNSVPPNEEFPFDASIQTKDKMTIRFRTKDIAIAFTNQDSRDQIYGYLGQLTYLQAYEYLKILQTGVYDEVKHQSLGIVKKQELIKMGVICSGCTLSASLKRMITTSIQQDLLITNNDPLKAPRVSRIQIDRLFQQTQTNRFNNVVLVCSDSPCMLTRPKKSQILFKANSHTLSMRSEYFQSFFKTFTRFQQNKYKKEQRYFLAIPDHPHSHLLLNYKLLMIYFFYGHMVLPHCFTLDQLLECYQLAQLYLIQGARRILLQQIMLKISSPDEVLENIKKETFLKAALGNVQTENLSQKTKINLNNQSNQKKFCVQYMQKLTKFCLQGADWENLSKILEMAVGKIILDAAKNNLLNESKKTTKKQAKKDKQNNIFSLAKISSVFCMGKKINNNTNNISSTKSSGKQQKNESKLKRMPNSLKSLNMKKSNSQQFGQQNRKDLNRLNSLKQQQTSINPKKSYFNPYELQSKIPSQSDIQFELQLQDVMTTLDQIQMKYDKSYYHRDKNGQGMSSLGQIVERVKDMYKLQVAFWRCSK